MNRTCPELDYSELMEPLCSVIDKDYVRKLKESKKLQRERGDRHYRWDGYYLWKFLRERERVAISSDGYVRFIHTHINSHTLKGLPSQGMGRSLVEILITKSAELEGTSIGELLKAFVKYCVDCEVFAVIRAFYGRMDLVNVFLPDNKTSDKVDTTKASQNGWGASRESIHNFNPFLDHINELTSDPYIERKAFIADFEASLHSIFKAGYQIITGSPRSGRSTLLAGMYKHFSKGDAFFCVPYFAQYESLYKSPAAFVKFIYEHTTNYYDLGELEEEFAPANLGNDQLVRHLVLKLLSAIAFRIKSRSLSHLMIMVDGIDYLEDEQKIASQEFFLPLALPESLPSGIFVLATSLRGREFTPRPGTACVTSIFAGARDLRDCKDYLERISEESGAKQWFAASGSSKAAFLELFEKCCVGEHAFDFLSTLLMTFRATASPLFMPEPYLKYIFRHLSPEEINEWKEFRRAAKASDDYVYVHAILKKFR